MDLVFFIEKWNQKLQDEDFLFKQNFCNIIDHLDYSMRDTNKRSYSNFELEIISDLSKWLSVHKKEKLILENIFKKNKENIHELVSLFNSLTNICDMQFFRDKIENPGGNYHEHNKIKQKDLDKRLSLLSLQIGKVNSILKDSLFIDYILEDFVFDLEEDIVEVYLTLIMNNLLNHYSKAYLKNLRFIIVKSLYEENYDSIVSEAKQNFQIMEEAKECIFRISELLNQCGEIDFKILYAKDLLGLSRKFRYLYHIYKRFLLTKGKPGSKYKEIRGLYETESASKFDTIEKLEEEFFYSVLDYIVKIILYTSSEEFNHGFIKFFKSFDSLLTQIINNRSVNETEAFSFPKHHDLDLGRNAIMGYISVLKTKISKKDEHNFTFLKNHIEIPEDKLFSPEFTEEFFNDLQDYVRKIYIGFRYVIGNVSIEPSKFLEDVFKNYITFIAKDQTAHDRDILPTSLTAAEQNIILSSIKQFVKVDDQKYVVYIKTKNLDILDKYLISKNLVIYEKDKIHLGFCYEIRDKFYNSSNDYICIICQVKSKDNNRAILDARKYITEFMNLAAYRRYTKPFDFYGYQAQIYNPIFELEFRVFSKQKISQEKGDEFSNMGREGRDKIITDQKDLKLLSMIQSSHNHGLNNAISWFKKGTFEVDSATKLLFHWIGLEQIMSQYGSKNNKYEAISRLLVDNYRSLPKLYFTYELILKSIKEYDGFEKLKSESSRKINWQRPITISDLEYISNIIEDDKIRDRIVTFVSDFKTEKSYLIRIFKLHVKREIFTIRRIETVRNRLVHSGKYDSRYDIFAGRMETSLYIILLRLLEYPNIHQFNIFFEKYDFLLQTPLTS